MAIVTLPQAKKQLNIPDADTSQDDEIQFYIAASSGAVDRERGEAVDPRTVVDELSLSNTTTFLLTTTPVTELTSVAAVDGSQTWDAADLHVDARSGRVIVLSGPPLSGLVAVTYTAGYDPVPANFQLAALIILQHLWETQRGAGVGVQFGNGDQEFAPPPGYAVPWRAAELLGSTLPGVA